MVSNYLIIKLFFTIVSINNFIEAFEQSKIIPTRDGFVQGQILRTVLQQVRYSAFKGIPYAKPPIGELRFKPPVKLDRRSTIYHAKKDGNMCLQYDSTSEKVLGSEDCLFLNIYTPEVKFNGQFEKRAVMVWIHGGAFLWGSNHQSTFGPDFLIEKNIVVVTTNYRLGALGFLTDGHRISGNMGLKDQVFALEWIKDNIALFGGDKNKITIFGQDAGAVSVELHRLSPLSKDLFWASIAMSGSPFNPWAFKKKNDADYMSRELYQSWRKNEVEVENKLLESNYLPLQTCLEKIVKITDEEMRSRAVLPFLPTKESPRVNNAFLTTTPVNIYKSRRASNKPHILGYTKDEFVGINSIFSTIYTKTYAFFYDPMEINQNYNYFTKGIDQTMSYLHEYTESTIYNYCNAFDYLNSLHRLRGIDKNGCGHGDDIAHIFYVQGKNQSLDLQSDIGKHREKIVTMWTNFAKYLDPTARNEGIEDISWQKATQNGYYLEINKNSFLNSKQIQNVSNFKDPDHGIDEFMNEYF